MRGYGAPDPALARAYAHSTGLLAAKARSFSFATHFLPAEQRRDVSLLYAFCRTVDDIADLPPGDGPLGDARSRLDHWRAWLHAGAPFADDPIKYGLAYVIRKHDLPLTPLHELLDGLYSDLEPRHLPDIETLDRYCYCVAGTVGIILATVLGAHDRRALAHARDLGMAMQVTNVLRDVGEDLACGRIYLAATDMARYHYRREDLERGVVDARFAALMRDYSAWARRLYRQGLIGLRYLPPASRLSIAIAAHAYAGILGEIEHAGYDVFTRRACTGRRKKVLLAARLALGHGAAHFSPAGTHAVSFIGSGARGEPLGKAAGAEGEQEW